MMKKKYYGCALTNWIQPTYLSVDAIWITTQRWLPHDHPSCINPVNETFVEPNMPSLCHFLLCHRCSKWPVKTFSNFTVEYDITLAVLVSGLVH